MAGTIAPNTAAMGGGMKREEVGANTSTYISYFDKQDSSKRKANYADVRPLRAAARPFPPAPLVRGLRGGRHLQPGAQP